MAVNSTDKPVSRETDQTRNFRVPGDVTLAAVKRFTTKLLQYSDLDLLYK